MAGKNSSFLYLTLSGNQMMDLISATTKIFQQEKYRNRVTVTTQSSTAYSWSTEIEALYPALLLEFIAELAMEMSLEEQIPVGVTDNLETLQMDIVSTVTDAAEESAEPYEQGDEEYENEDGTSLPPSDVEEEDEESADEDEEGAKDSDAKESMTPKTSSKKVPRRRPTGNPNITIEED
jgi:hypothetical protein